MNLLTGTKDFSGARDGLDRWYKDGTYNDCVVYSKDSAWGGIEYNIDVVEGEQYTFSAWIKSNAPIESINFTTEAVSPYTPDNVFDIQNPKIETYNTYVENEWVRVFVNLKATKTLTAGFRFELKEEYKISICGVKAERGTVTDPVWTPAPEDVVVKSELPGLISYKDIELKQITADTVANYTKIATLSIPDGWAVASCIVLRWSTNTGNFSVVVSSSKNTATIYMISGKDITVYNLVVRVLFMKNIFTELNTTVQTFDSATSDEPSDDLNIN